MPSPSLTPRKITLLLASTLTVMSGATIAAALPLIQQEFSANPQAAFLSKLILTVPALLIAICSPLAGWLVDRFGRLRLLVVGLVLYTIGGAGGGLMGSLETLLASRALLGVAVALVMTTSSTLIADYYQGAERTDLIGKQAAYQSLGGILFISAGGALAGVDWRWPFAIYLLALVLLPLVWRYLEEPSRIVKGGEAAGASTVEEEQGGYWPVAVLIFVILFFTMIVFYMTPVQLPFLLANLGVNSTLTGLGVAAVTLSSAVASLNFRRVKARLAPITIIGVAFVLLGIGYVLVGWSEAYFAIVVAMLISGLGLGILMPNVTQVVMAVAPGPKRGLLLGILSSCIFLGQFMSPIAVAPVIAATDLPTTFTYAGYVTIVVGGSFLVYALTGRGNPALFGVPNPAPSN